MQWKQISHTPQFEITQVNQVMSEPMERCENCRQQFPESKINSHFSYCRRNIKRCEQCGQMVDINYLEQHNQDFHTKQPCKYCKKQLSPQELTKHQSVCPSKPKYCEFCQLNIAVNEFDKHVNTCGSRTKVCPLCEKNIILRDYDVHSVSCMGKQAPTVPVTVKPEVNTRAFQKKQPDVRRQQPIPATQNLQPKADTFMYKHTSPEVNYPTNQRKQDPVVTHNIPPNANRPANNPTVVPTNSRSSNTTGTTATNVNSVGISKQIKKQTKPEERKVYNPPTGADKYSYGQPSRDVPTNIPKNPIKVEPPKYDTRANERGNIQPTRSYQQPVPTVPNRRQPQQNVHPMYEEQRQHMRNHQREAEQQRNRSPVYQPPSEMFQPSAEQAQIQRALFESMQMNKQGGYTHHQLGIQDLSQSFYRDLQLQNEIENRIKNEKRPARR